MGKCEWLARFKVTAEPLIYSYEYEPIRAGLVLLNPIP